MAIANKQASSLANLTACICLVSLISGCTAKQGYLVLQDWQRQECRLVYDKHELEQCEVAAERSYEDYINSDEYKRAND